MLQADHGNSAFAERKTALHHTALIKQADSWCDIKTYDDLDLV